MKKFSRTAALALMILFANAAASFACTSIIVSGRITPDGRPFMWKNRDAGVHGNMMQYFAADAEKGTLSYTAVVNDHTQKYKSVWAGTNEKGFSIMNTMSYNVDFDKDHKGGRYSNGEFMKYAIQRCGSVAEFEELLKWVTALPEGSGITSNYGVLDAEGNAAYFEVEHYHYYKFDVNDPEVAPDGYLVRSNFSFNGRPRTEGRGHLRYEQADILMKEAIAAKADITPEYFLKNICRSYANPLMQINLLGDAKNAPKTEGWAYDTDFITRKTSVGGTLLKSVKKGENKDLIMMYAIISYPGVTVAMPVWPAAGYDAIPRMIRADSKGRCILSDWGVTLKKRLYSWDLDDIEDNAKKYFNFGLLCNAEGTGYFQKIMKLESEILPPYQAEMKKFDKAGKIDVAKIQALNSVADARVEEFYKTNFGL